MAVFLYLKLITVLKPGKKSHIVFWNKVEQWAFSLKTVTVMTSDLDDIIQILSHPADFVENVIVAVAKLKYGASIRATYSIISDKERVMNVTNNS